VSPVIVPLGLIRPTTGLPLSVNQTLPSGPAPIATRSLPAQAAAVLGDRPERTRHGPTVALLRAWRLQMARLTEISRLERVQASAPV
jgi:hypothetical protein